MKYTEKISNKLNQLLSKSYDAAKGYKKAVENVNDTDIKMFLKNMSGQRERFATDLRQEILSYGELPEDSGSVAGAAHRAWMDLRSLFSSNDEQAILKECIRGEKAAIEEYNDILKDSDVLPPTTVAMLTRHRDYIQQAINNVKVLEEAVS